MTELKDRVKEYLRAYESRNTFKNDVEACPKCHESYDPYYMSYCELHEGKEQLILRCAHSPVTLIKDQQSRITELEAAIEYHLKYPLMGSKGLKEALGK